MEKVHKLYSTLAEVYDEMYQKIFDYEKMFKDFNSILSDLKVKKIVEVGCGSGNLALKFNEHYDYIGLDLSNEMLEIAKKRNPKIKFVQGDMRKLESVLNEKFDCVLITGKSFTYMNTNEDVMKALKSVNSILKSEGYLVFDNFCATKIFEGFKGGFVGVHEINGKKFTRNSKSKMNLKEGWTWDWEAEYIVEKDGKELKRVKDFTTLRAFTVDEISLFLFLCGMKKIQILREENGSKFVTVAQKIVK